MGVPVVSYAPLPMFMAATLLSLVIIESVGLRKESARSLRESIEYMTKFVTQGLTHFSKEYAGFVYWQPA